jgi:hypothetical protein
MCKRFILLLGMFLGRREPVAGQTHLPHIVLAQEQGAQTMTMPRTVSIPGLNPSFLLSQDPGKLPAHFSLMFAGAYQREPSLQHLLPMDEIKTLTLTQSSLQLFQLWGGKLQLGVFRSTLHNQNVQVGPLGFGGKEGFPPTRQSSLCGPLSVHFSGFSLSFHFDRDSRTRPSAQAWRGMTQSVGAILN